jgi:hypothetical protein
MKFNFKKFCWFISTCVPLIAPNRFSLICYIYNWILNIDDKKFHENTAEASEYITCAATVINNCSNPLFISATCPEHSYAALRTWLYTKEVVGCQIWWFRMLSFGTSPLRPLSRSGHLASEITTFGAPWFLLVRLCQNAMYRCTGQAANLDELKQQMTAAVITATREAGHNWLSDR